MKVKKLQQGGEVVDPQMQEAQQAPQETQANPEEQIMAMGQQIIQELGPEGAAMLAQIIMEMLQGSGEPQPQPTFQRKGGTLKRKN